MDELSIPQFTVCVETASFLASSGFLEHSWNEICIANRENRGPFLLKRHEGVAYLSFSSLYMEVRDGKYDECNIQNADTVFFPSLKGDDDQPALAHKGAFNRFQYILENTDLEAQVSALRGQAIIFGGHSIGGAVATLATLWFLAKGVRNTSPFCITFGSPLVGDARFREAIVRQDWSGRFCHVVSQHDIIPRVFLACFESIAEPLNSIVPHWWSIDSIAGSNLPIQEASRILLNNVTCSPRSLYKPSGTYMFCSINRAACFDDSEVVLKILHYTIQSNQGLSFDQIACACISEHAGYGKLMNDITGNLQNSWQIENLIPDSFEMGIALALEAVGVGAQNMDILTALRKASEMKNEQDTNVDRLNFELSESQSYMSQLGWYKLACKPLGYYDTFKPQIGKRDIKADEWRIKLALFWDKIVGMVEKHELPSDFQSQNKWINAGNAYRKLVEPLDIASYYENDRKHGNRGTYVSAGVRPHRHVVLEKWLDDKNRTRTGRDKKARTKFASLTEDSCFWAHVEEALKTVQHQIMNAQANETLEKFENYVWTMIENRSISDEVFLEGSSFMTW